MERAVYPLPRIDVGSLDRVEETRPVALFTSAPAWDALGGALALPEVWRAEPDEATLEAFEGLAGAVPEATEAVYAVGGGSAVDAAKVAARRHGLPLVGVPTALSVDAHLTPVSGVRRDGGVAYVETGAPGLLHLDWDVIAAAPPWLRAAGICDVLSIATGLWDWRYAESRGRNAPDQRFVPYAARIAEALLGEALAIADSAGRGEVVGLERLLDLLALKVHLGILLGHARHAHGSERHFAGSIENLIGPGLPGAELVGPGIVAMAAAQGQDVAPLHEALLAAGVRLDRLPIDAVVETLDTLPAYVHRHGLPYGVAHELHPKRIAAALEALA